MLELQKKLKNWSKIAPQINEQKKKTEEQGEKARNCKYYIFAAKQSYILRSRTILRKPLIDAYCMTRAITCRTSRPLMWQCDVKEGGLQRIFIMRVLL